MEIEKRISYKTNPRFVNVVFRPELVCTQQVEFDLYWAFIDTEFGAETGYLTEESVIRNLSFTGGCDGNLKSIAILCEGVACSKILTLSEVTCKTKSTSCMGQLCECIRFILNLHF